MSTAIDFKLLPRTSFLTSSPEGVKAYVGPSDIKFDDVNFHPPTINKSLSFPYSTQNIIINKDGRYGLIINGTANEVITIDMGNGSQIYSFKTEGQVQVASFSPNSNFVVTWEKPSKDGGDIPNNNLKVWSLETGKVVASFFQKNYNKDLWPFLRFTDDDLIVCLKVKTGVHFYNTSSWTSGKDAEEYIKLEEEKLTAFSISSGPPPYNVATFIAGKGGNPGAVKVYSYPELKVHTAKATIMKADSVDFKWSPDGKRVLAHCQTELDTTGTSYYGETFLQLITCDGSKCERVGLTKEGPIHDVQWDPQNKGFVTIAGKMPPRTTLFNIEGTALYELGEKARNVISWSPHGRFLVIAGFGNLAGYVDFWDRNKIVSGKGLLASVLAHHPTSHEWSPDSRFFMTATTYPRLREGNKFQIFKYNGPLVYEEDVKDLYQASWRPAPKGIYPDRPQSPKAVSKDGVEVAPLVAPVPVKAAPYRPPHATGYLAEKLRREKGENFESKKISQKPVTAKETPAPLINLIPGQAPPSAKDNKQKKQKKKDDNDDSGVGECIAPPLPDAVLALLGKGPSAPVLKKEEPKVVVEEKKEEKMDAEAIGKKIKNLNKKLKQVEELREKEKAGAELNEDQKMKIKTLHMIKTEISDLTKLLPK